MTPYTIEIERMVLGLEHLGAGFGGSLERTIFDRLLGNLMDLTVAWVNPDAVFSKTNEEIYLLWQDLYENFHRLTDNAADYLAHLHSKKVEEQMMTDAFLVYKEALTEYLRNFMTSLQRTSFRIEGLLEEAPLTFSQKLTECVADYELSIPRLDVRPSKEQLMERFQNEWESLRTWFLGEGGSESDLLYLQNATNDTIRRLTRFAQRLGETHHNLRNRRLDYLHLAKWFSNLDTVQEAHELSACVFGVFDTRHLWADRPKQTESFEVEIWDEPPSEIEIRPKVRNYREKGRPNAVVDFLRTHQRLLQTTKALDRLHLERENAKIALVSQQETETILKREQQVLDVEREALGEHDVFKAEKERERLLKEQQKNQVILAGKNKQLTNNVSKEGTLKDQIGKLELKEQHALATIHEELEELDSLAEESAFLNHEIAADEFNREIDRTFSFALWKKEAFDYQRLLENVMKLLRQESGAKERYQEADLALSETKKAWDEEQYQEKKWADLLHEERFSWVAQLFEWQPMNQELRFQDIELQTLALRARSFPESVNQSTLAVQYTEPYCQLWLQAISKKQPGHQYASAQ